MQYLYNPLQSGQDHFFHYYRFQALMEGLKSSSFLIYLDYSAIDGYGYFSKAFYSDFILIPFAVIGNFTNLYVGYQSMIFSMTVLCGVFSYHAANKILSSTFIASMSAILYTFCFYRLLDVYHRAAIGEALSFTFFPIVILGLYYIIKDDYRKWYILSIGFSLMIFTHVISTILMLIVVAIILIICYKDFYKDSKRLLFIVLAGFSSLVITAYYLYPIIEQMMSNTFYFQTNNIMSRPQESGLGPHWIIWGMFGGIVQARQLFLPGIGLLLTLGLMLRLFISNNTHSEFKWADTSLILGFILLFATSSLFPWAHFPFNKLEFIQLPWRLLEFASYFFAISGAYYLSIILISRKQRIMSVLLLILLTLLVLINDANLYLNIRSSDITREKPTLVNNYHLGGLEYIPSKVPSLDYLINRGFVVKSMGNHSTINNLSRDGKNIQFDVSNIKESDILELPLIYYKGYKAICDNEPLYIEESSNGLVQIKVNKSGRIEVFYDGTLTQKISFLITILAIVTLIIYICLQRKNLLKRHINSSHR